MSAAATAAGYLYASGRLRGKNKEHEGQNHVGPGHAPAQQRERLRVAALPEPLAAPEIQAAARPKRVPRVEYRVRRWRPE